MIVEPLEERNAPDNLASSAPALDGIPGEPIDSLTALSSLPDLWGSPHGQTMQAASGAGDDAEDRVPLSAEDISISGLLSRSESNDTARQGSASSGASVMGTADPGDLDQAMLALSGAGNWGAGFTAPLTSGLAGTLSDSSGLAGSGQQPPEVQIGSPAAAPTEFPNLSSPTSPSTSDFSPSFAGPTASAPASSVAPRTALLAYITPAFPDGRAMDGGLPPAGISTPGSGSSGMVLSQVYADGGQSGSQFRQDYVELFNRGTTAVNVSGWSVQYADAGSGTWQVAALSGMVAPGQYYLLQCWSGPAGNGDIPAADATCSINLGDTAGKVALVNSTTPLVGAVPSGSMIVDLVGYGTADAYEGSGPAPAGSTTLATLRDNGGLDDSDDNGYDFTADTPAPRNSVSPLANLPPVSTVPGSQTTAQDTALVFSAANGNVLSVSDYDAGSSPVEVFLSATNGTLTLSTTAGLTFSQGSGTADTDMTFTGTISAINTALNGLSFAPAAGYRGPATISISTDDLGNTGTGGEQSGFGVVLVSVGGPLVAVDDSFATWEDTPTDFDVLGNDAFIHGDSLAVRVLSGPAHGQATVDANIITYAPAPNFAGADSLTYQVADTFGNTSTASVALSVVAINDARIVPPPDQGSSEGSSVSLQLETPDNTGVPLTFSATGLPAGLSIDSSTGIISGQPLYSDAETNGGAYTVSVTASGGGESDTETFTWYITDTNRIDLIDDQASRAGSSVSFQPGVHDNLGNTLTFSASGLPTGLSINPTTGLVSGTVASQPPGITDFTTTITVTGGGDSDSQTFIWHVLSGSDPIVLFAVNNTLRTDDDVTLVDPQLPLDVRVTLYAPGTPFPQTITLTVSGPSSLNMNTLQLMDGQSATVTLTPQQVSQQEDDVVLLAFAGIPLHQVGMGKETNINIVITTAGGVGKVRAANTPDGMADRIPPRVKTPFTVNFAGPQLQNKEFVIAEYGHSADNGDVGLYKAGGQNQKLYEWYPVVPATVNGLYSSNLQGMKQTEPRHAGQLKLAVFRQGEQNNPGKVLVQTTGFSVAAIPVAIEMLTPTPAGGKDYGTDRFWIRWGANYKFTIASDSRKSDDLNKVTLREKIEIDPQKLTGAATSLGKGVMTGTPMEGNKTNLSDFNGYGLPQDKLPGLTEAQVRAFYARVYRQLVDRLGKGTGDLSQYFIFWDLRTGMIETNAVKVNQSGFNSHIVMEKVGGKYFIELKKTPNANNGVEAGIMDAAAQNSIQDEVKP